MAGNIRLISKVALPLLKSCPVKQIKCLTIDVTKVPLPLPSVCKILAVTNHSALNAHRLQEQNKTSQDRTTLLAKYSVNCYNGKRPFTSDKNNKKSKKRVPRLILLQNPFTWLMTKFDFMVLKYIWDSTFVEREFRFGTRQAISRVTQVISGKQLEELNGLLTKPARMSLLRELDRNWSSKQRSLLSLNRDDIQISSPRKVYFIRIADKKYCDVDMSFLALKWIPIQTFNALLFTEIFARFHREYTPHSIPEWTIAFFKVTRFEIIKKEDKELN